MANAKIVALYGGATSASTYQIKRSTTYANSVAGDISTRFGNNPNFFDDFGCDRSGATDDTTKANNALASVMATGKAGIIEIPNNCKLNVNYLSIPSGVTILGAGRFSVLQFAGSAPSTSGRIDSNGSSDWAINNLFIDGGVTSPVGVDYANIVSPVAATLVGGGAGLPVGSSIWIRGGGSNIDISGNWFNHSGGYSILLDASSANISRVRIHRNRFTNCRPHLFGYAGVGLGLAYGAWTGGIHYHGEGTNYIVEDVTVDWNQFYQMAGHCFWGSSGAITKQNRNIYFMHNQARDHALDMCEMAVTDGFKVIGNKSVRCGYYSATDDAVGVPRWGSVAPAAIDHTRNCTSGLITENNIECCNGTAIDGDGLGNSVVSHNKCVSAWSSNDPNAQVSSCGPCTYAAGTNIAVGFNLGNTYNDSLSGKSVEVSNNQFDGFGAGMVRLYTGRYCKAFGNHGDHPVYKGTSSSYGGADAPIQLGPTSGSAYQRCYGNEVSGNTINWSPAASAPLVVEDPQYSDFLSTEVNYIHDNTCTSGSASVYQSNKAGTSSSTTGALRAGSVSTQGTNVCEYVMQTEHSTLGGTDAILKIYKNIATGTWVAGTLYRKGTVILDSGGHYQVATATGTSGGSTPSFSHAGGTTSDGSVTWQDGGTPGATNLVAYFTDKTTNIPSLTVSGNGAIDSVRNFTGNSLTVQGATPSLVIDSSANLFGRSLTIGAPGTPYDLLTNTASNVIDGSAVGSTHGSGITWRNAANGYMWAVENYLNSTNANGLLVKIARANVDTRAFTVNINNTDYVAVTGDGALSAYTYKVSGSTVFDNNRSLFAMGHSIITEDGGGPLALGGGNYGWTLTLQETTNTTGYNYDGPHLGWVKRINTGGDVYWKMGIAPGSTATNWHLTRTSGAGVDVITADYTTGAVNIPGTLTVGTFGISSAVLGNLSTFSATPLVAKSPGAFDYSNDYTPAVILLNCASVSAMNNLHLDPGVGFNTLREAGLHICTIVPSSGSNEWEVDGLICNVVTYATPGPPSGPLPHGGGSVAGSFMALSQVTGGTVWAQNWLIRDWASWPAYNYQSLLAGLECDMGIANANTVATGIAVNVNWDSTFSTTIPYSAGIQIQTPGHGSYFQTGIGFQDAACTSALRIGNAPSSFGGKTSDITWCSYNNANHYAGTPGWSVTRNYATLFATTSDGSLVFTFGIYTGTSKVVYFDGTSGNLQVINGGYSLASGVVISGNADFYGRSFTQQPPLWKYNTFYTAETAITNGFSVFIAANTGLSSAFFYPSFNNTPGTTTTESSGLQWVCQGPPYNAIDQANNARFSYLNIQPGYVSNPVSNALSINNVGCIDISRNATFGFCSAVAFNCGTGGSVIKTTGGVATIQGVDTITAGGAVTCAGVNAGGNGITTGGLTIHTSSGLDYLGLGNKDNYCDLYFSSGFILSYAGGTPGSNPTPGTYHHLRIRGGVITIDPQP